MMSNPGYMESRSQPSFSHQHSLSPPPPLGAEARISAKLAPLVLLPLPPTSLVRKMPKSHHPPLHKAPRISA